MGIPMIEGDLLRRGLRAPRSEIWQVLRDHDPASLSARWAEPIHRRQYSVRGKQIYNNMLKEFLKSDVFTARGMFRRRPAQFKEYSGRSGVSPNGNFG